MKKPLAIGIVGYGYWGPNLARNFCNLASAKLVAVADLDESRLEAMQDLYPAVAGFKDFGEMLQQVELDAIAIASPIASHHALAKASLLAGKHVLVEKPMACTSEQCQELINLARDTGLTLMVGHTYRYSEPLRKVSEIIASGDIGELKYINCQRLNLGLFKQDINVVWDLAPHDLSIIVHLMGEFPHLINCQGNANINPRVEDVANLSLSFSKNRFATIQSSWLEPRKVRQMTFVGTLKMIVYDDLQPLEKIRIYDVRVDCPPHYDSFAEFQYSYHYGDCFIPHLTQSEPLHQMCAHFVDCVLNDQVPLTPGEEGLEIVRILEASSLSLKTAGGPVSLNSHRILEMDSASRQLPAAV